VTQLETGAAPPSGASPPRKRLACVAVTIGGVAAARRLRTAWPTVTCYIPAKLASGDDPFDAVYDEPVRALVGRLFHEYDGLILCVAVGAAVRLLAPHLRQKQTDPAVVTVDDGCRYAVSLLSGHQGGANDLARAAAEVLGAMPVITTASDVHHLPALDLLGREDGWRIEATPLALKQAAAALINGDRIAIYQDTGDTVWQDALPAGQRLNCSSLHSVLQGIGLHASSCVDHTLGQPDVPPGKDAAPPDNPSGIGAVLLVTDHDLGDMVSLLLVPTVVYRPRTIIAGVGCSRGASVDEIDALLREACCEGGVSPLALREVATIDLKANEEGINALAARYGVPVRHYSAPQLDAVTAPNPSNVVREAVGTSGVCEPAALLASGADALLVPKRKSSRATIALARMPWL